MKQPSLGKRITKLRKAKGFTQEELVEKCKLNVRTLQRIEAGEVMPRSYTIKLIFSALGEEVFNVAPNKLVDRLQNEIRKYYAYIIDLFNLKTNAMKKLTILTISGLTICTIVLSACLTTEKTIKEQVNASSMLGTWQLLKNGKPDTNYNNTPSQVRYKTITPGKFVVTDVMFRDKVVRAAFSGNATVDDGIYTEEIDVTGGPGYAYMLGKKSSFKYSIKDSILTINGINNNYNEEWRRIK